MNNSGFSFLCQKLAFKMGTRPFRTFARSPSVPWSSARTGEVFGFEHKRAVGELGTEHVPENMESRGIRNYGIPFFGINLFELTEVVFCLELKRI